MEIAILILGIASLLVGWFFSTELGYKVYDYLLDLMDIDENDYPDE